MRRPRMRAASTTPAAVSSQYQPFGQSASPHGVQVPSSHAARFGGGAVRSSSFVLGVASLGELHRVRDVGKQDGNGFALALKRALGGENLVDEMAWRVGARFGGQRRQGRAAGVAEPRLGGILVSAG